ncbi:hypothetical protein BH09SUM1_BH09SUM1_22940 [soil metagenome]
MNWTDRQEAESLWREAHRQFALEFADRVVVRETGAAHAVHVDERLVQAIWSDQMLAGDRLATASGKTLEIIEPGRWNTARGPDFLDARIRLAGEIVTGDVEIHVESADWRRHGHHQDFEYNRVILHVALRAHDDRPYEEKQNGERLERLVLGEFLEPDLETVRATINLADYPYSRPAELGLCHEQFIRLPQEQLQDFLIRAGRARIEQKVARFAAQRGAADFRQVIYQSLMTGQGFKASKTLYFLLSKRAPLAELVDHGRDVVAGDRADFFFSALAHVARLVPEQGDLTELDEESAAFLKKITALWQPVSPYFRDRFLPPSKRWFAGVRPASFPTRRLAAVAVLLGRLTNSDHPLFAEFCAAIKGADLSGKKPKEISAFWKKLAELITVDGDEHYFGTHFSFGGKKQKPQALLGEPAALSLIFNTFLPLAILKAREIKDVELEKSAWRLVAIFPALEKNSVVRFMERRLFGEAGGDAGLFRREIFQQSLLKVFSDCCAQNERTCDDCTFLSLANAEQSAR